ncbi:MAG: alpha/beta hydrolase [Ferruginibacter sp.]
MTVEKALVVGPSKIDIAYQRFGKDDAPPVFLLMGAGAQMISWADGFCSELVNRNLQIIRFDNRDIGLSTHIENVPVPDYEAASKGDFSTVPYSLSDMAADVVGLMDYLNFQNKLSAQKNNDQLINSYGLQQEHCKTDTERANV